MSERAIKTFDAEAQDYYIRGTGAARGGQRTMATRMLREAIRLNPYHEHAWLALSGVLDDPDDVLFCLRSVLQINPLNDRARTTLERLEGRSSTGSDTVLAADNDGTYYTRTTKGGPWWTQWRDARFVWRQVRRTVWLFPFLLLGVTLVLRAMLILQPLPQFSTYRDLEAPAPTADVMDAFLALEAAAPAALPTEETQQQQDTLNQYWSDIKVIRAGLQAATTTYRQQTAQSRTTIDRAAAARILLEELHRADAALVRLLPPDGTREAHTAYVHGLAEERQAIDDLLTFFNDNNVIYANRAGVRLQSARIKISEALAAWNRYALETSTDFDDVAGQSNQ